jgi:hypothetical protein
MRIVGGDRVGEIAVGPADVKAQDLAQQLLRILGTILRVAARSAVAHRDQEVTLRVEGERTAVVVRVRILEAEDDLLRVRIQGIGVQAGRERTDDVVTVRRAVVDEHPRVLWVGRVEGQPEQATLAARGDPIADVEERRVDPRAVLEDPHPAVLLDDVQPPGPVARMGHEQRPVEPSGERLGVDPEAVQAA